MPKDLLVEIGVEPFPARFIAPAVRQLEEKLRAELQGARLGIGETKSYATLRRLAVVVAKVDEKSKPLEETLFGAPESKAKNPDGTWSPAAEGFAKKCGTSVDKLRFEDSPKGRVLAFSRTVPGERVEDVLSRVVPAVLKAMEFPKTLEWEETRFRFGRPIRSLTVLLGAKAVPVTVAGVKAGAKVRGLAALGEKPVALSAPAKYADALRRALVLADVSERKDALLKKLQAAQKEAGGKIDLDEDLVDETVFMAEHPTPVVGRFSEEFLELPAALLALVMKKQLKFFPVYQDKDKLAAAFVGVRDGVSEGQELVREGYQRVLSARGNDAVFFFRRDLAHTLESRLPMLERVTYQKQLGSMAQKAKRVAEIAEMLCGMVRQSRPVDEQAASKIAALCYADLVTDVVREFPELQGVMGGVYARKQGYDERVGLGLEQFYLPVGPKSPVPTTAEGAIVSLAGKLDSLAGIFSIGQVPSGSADPFALRRQALGAVRIVLEHQLPVDLAAALEFAANVQPVKSEKAAAQLRDFVWGRAQSFFEEKGFRVDEVRSVSLAGLEDLRKTYLRLCAVRDVRKLPDFEALAAAFKRAANILRQAKLSPFMAEPPEREGLKEDAELKLYDALTSLEGMAMEKFANDGFEPGLRALVAVKPHLDLFFDKVMVMADDAALKRQRLALLAKLVRLFSSVADLSELQGASAN